MAAVLYGVDRNKTFTEADWSNPTGKGIGAYEKSKTIAERAAWDFMKTLEAGSLQLVTINPGLVMGPVLSSDFSTSGEIVKKLLLREFPACPDINYCVVDARDVAAALETANPGRNGHVDGRHDDRPRCRETERLTFRSATGRAAAAGSSRRSTRGRGRGIERLSGPQEGRC